MEGYFRILNKAIWKKVRRLKEENLKLEVLKARDRPLGRKEAPSSTGGFSDCGSGTLLGKNVVQNGRKGFAWGGNCF